MFRAYHTVPNTVTDLDGNPMNALHGFARFLGDLVEEVSPQYIAVAFDESLATAYRKRLYPAYKANREPAPEDLRRQFALCRRMCEAFGVRTFLSGEYEADDVIGTLATRMRLLGQKITILSRDKDLSQLLRPGDVYWDYIGDKRYSYDDVAGRFGVRPERMACFLALMGDAVDNIPGVPGIGRKTATTLFHHFESLRHLYEELDGVLQLRIRNGPFVVGQLREHRNSAFLARQLTEIACDMPLIADLTELRRCAPDLSALNQFYDSVGFGRLLRNQAERVIGLKAA